MSDDLREIFSRPTTISLANGKEVCAKPLDFEDFTDLQNWLDGHQPNVIDEVERQFIRGRIVSDGNGGFKREPYPEDMQKFLYDRAVYWTKSRTVFLGSPESDALFRSQLGVRQLARMSLRKGTPGITDAEVDEVLKMMDDQQKGRLAAAAEVPRSGRPKAPDPDGSPATVPRTGPVPSGGVTSSAT